MTTGDTQNAPRHPARTDPALQALFDEHYGTVEAALTQLHVPRTERRDVAAHVWVTAFSRYNQASIRETGLWIYEIAKRCVFAHRRAQTMLSTLLDLSEAQHVAAPDDFETFEDVEQMRKRARLLEQALSALAPDEREVYEAKHLHGISLRDYAQQNNLSRDAVDARYARAKRRVFALARGFEERQERRKFRALMPLVAMAFANSAAMKAERAEVWARAWALLESYRPKSGAAPKPRQTPPGGLSRIVRGGLSQIIQISPLLLAPHALSGVIGGMIVWLLHVWPGCSPVPAREAAQPVPMVAVMIAEEPAPSNPSEETAAPSAAPKPASRPEESAAPSATSAPPPLNDAPTDRFVAAELALIRAAQKARMEHRFDEAESKLRLHERDYPNGSMRNVRARERERLRQARQAAPAYVNMASP